MSTYPVHLYPGCPCRRCDSVTWEWFYRDNGLFQRMSLCPECGSKRCPGAMDHLRHPPPVPQPSREDDGT